MHLTMPGGSELNFSLINHADFLTQIGRSDQFHHGIGVERYTPVFQTGVERALLSCPSISRDANTGAGKDITGLAAEVQLRLRVAPRVANFDSEAPALTRMEHGANPWRPTISPMWLSSDSSSFVNCRALPHESASLSVGPILREEGQIEK